MAHFWRPKLSFGPTNTPDRPEIVIIEGAEPRSGVGVARCVSMGRYRDRGAILRGFARQSLLLSHINRTVRRGAACGRREPCRSCRHWSHRAAAWRGWADTRRLSAAAPNMPGQPRSRTIGTQPSAWRLRARKRLPGHILAQDGRRIRSVTASSNGAQRIRISGYSSQRVSIAIAQGGERRRTAVFPLRRSAAERQSDIHQSARAP